MPTDSNIPMQVQGGQAAPQDTATPIYQAQNQQNKNAMSAEQLLQAHYQNLGERDKQRLQSSIVGAAQLKPYLDNGDIQGARNFLMQRKAALQKRMGSGENVDTQETDYALQALQSGPDGLKQLQNDVNGLFAAGSVYGIVNPEANKQFKLSPGETQYDSSGKPLVTAPINAGFGGMGGAAQPGGMPGQGANASGGTPPAAGASPTTPQPTQYDEVGLPVAGSGQRNEAFLKQMDPGTAAQVKALADGRQDFPKGYALKSPYWQAMMNAVATYDPSYDTNNAGTRAATRKSFTSGADHKNIVRLDTAINTLAQLHDANQALGGPQYGNSVRNAALDAASDPNLVKYNQLAKTAADEVAYAVGGGNSSDSDRKNRLNSFTAAQSPEARQAAIDTAIKELDARLEPVGESYNKGMQTSVHGIELLSPKTQAAYYKATGAKPSSDIGGSGGAPAAGGKVTVSNGKQTFHIDQADLAAATKDGFKQVQ